MMRSIYRIGSVLIGVVGLCGVGLAQKKLTLDEALNLAKKRNGTILAAKQEIRASRARVQNAFGAFLPDITPSYIYSDSRREIADTQFGAQGLSFIQNSTQIQTRFQWLDTGQRSANYRARRHNLTASEAQAMQTLRETLFSVHQQYLETLRTQELQKVADSQVARASLVLEQTQSRVQVGDAAKREILQATADRLNATVNSITAKNRTVTNAANLKATIGLNKDEALPELAPVSLELNKAALPVMSLLVNDGLKKRPDLIATRSGLSSTRETERIAVIDSGITVVGNFTYDVQLTPDRLTNQNYSLIFSFPLFDGFQRRATLNEAQANLEAARRRLEQAERAALAEIETAYLTYGQNVERTSAARLATDAARLNYEAAVESQKLGASNLIDVLTAQVSLITSETNLIEATYDTLISELRLKLVTGQEIPGQ